MKNALPLVAFAFLFLGLFGLRYFTHARKGIHSVEDLRPLLPALKFSKGKDTESYLIANKEVSATDVYFAHQANWRGPIAGQIWVQTIQGGVGKFQHGI